MIRSSKPEPGENKFPVGAFFSVLLDTRAWGALPSLTQKKRCVKRLANGRYPTLSLSHKIC